MPKLRARTQPGFYPFLDAHLSHHFPASHVLDGTVNFPKDVGRNDSCYFQSWSLKIPM